MKPNYAMVHWTDASSEDNDHGLTDGVAIGWVVEDNEEYIALATELGEEGDYRFHLSIPKVNVNDIKYFTL